MRRIIAIIVGLVIALIVIDIFWGRALSWFPAPSEDRDATRFVVAMPIAGKLLITCGWFVAGLASSFIALRVSQWRPAGWIVGAVIVGLGIRNYIEVTQPIWMHLTAAILPLIGCFLAERHFHRARPGDPLIN